LRASRQIKGAQRLDDKGESTPFDSASFLSSLPKLPGVYRMLDEAQQVLYVGKAGNLKQRVSSYFQKTDLSPRIRLMVSRIAAVEITVTRSEAEALLLENNLIKALSPRYNILFRDDKSYPYLLLTGHAFPRLMVFRGTPKRGDRCFGPFPNAGAVRDSLDILQKIFQLRTCEDTVFAHRSRPCLLHQIKRCSAPCVGEGGATAYAADVAHAEQFLLGKTDQLLNDITTRMQQAAMAQHYEQAAALRDQVRSLTAVRERQSVTDLGSVDVDVVAVASGQGMVCVNLGMIRGGQYLGDRSLFPRNAQDADLQETLSAFLTQHYLDAIAPAQIIVSEEGDWRAIAEVLSEQVGHPLTIHHQVSGQRRRWLDMALSNARLAILREANQKNTQTQRLAALRLALAMPDLQRIECFDISHTMGEATVASCVVYDHEAMQPSQYRLFNLRTNKAGDDYGAMREALTRRYTRIREGEGVRADLVLIDGGLGQLHAAAEVMIESGMGDIPLIGVAKGVERKAGMEQLVAMDGSSRRMSPDDPALHLIQQIRDEAHRFAITGHRARRAKARNVSVLENMPGIGPKRRQKLLERFGGLRELKNAGVEDIAKVAGISRALAEEIYRGLH